MKISKVREDEKLGSPDDLWVFFLGLGGVEENEGVRRGCPLNKWETCTLVFVGHVEPNKALSKGKGGPTTKTLGKLGGDKKDALPKLSGVPESENGKWCGLMVVKIPEESFP